MLVAAIFNCVQSLASPACTDYNITDNVVTPRSGIEAGRRITTLLSRRIDGHTYHR